ncbi:cytochrome P450 1A2, partial [Colletotrichum limetticola]
MAARENTGQDLSKAVLSNMSQKSCKDMYDKILVASSPIFVFQESPDRPIEFFVPGKSTQWPASALTKFREYNEQETDAVFYGSNHFHLVDTAMQRETSILQAFLLSPMSTHARLLSHLSLSFPALEVAEGRPEGLGLTQDGVRALKLLKDHCTSLATLELYVHKSNAFGLTGEAPGASQSCHEVLLQVKAQLKTISSLNKVIIRYCHDKPTPHVVQLMQDLEWTVLMGDGLEGK